MNAVADLESRGYIDSAMSEWSGKTCVQFRKKTYDDEDYLEFVYEVGYVQCSALTRNHDQLTFFPPSELNCAIFARILYSVFRRFLCKTQYVDPRVLWNNFHSKGPR